MIKTEIADFVTLAVVQRKYLPLSRATLTRMCQEGKFETAWKPGRGISSPWRIARWEALKHSINSFPAGF